MFRERFWSSGYTNGVETLFEKLEQGCVENSEVLGLASSRADAELAYGTSLSELTSTLPLNRNGFGRDDGATLKRSYEGIIQEMSKEGTQHIQVARNIQSMVVEPFTKWSSLHKSRVDRSKETLRKKIRQYEREHAEALRSQKRYFNKCRLLEDAKEGDGGENSEEDAANNDEKPTSEELTLAGRLWSSEDAQALVARMLREIPQRSYRVAILGTYENCSWGSDVVEFMVKNKVAGSVAEAEKAGQDLINAGMLRLVGQVGRQFANSSVMAYQWRPHAWSFAGFSHHGPDLGALTELGERWGFGGDIEVKELDQRYRKNVQILDNVRCELEEQISEHLAFMERCELDRLKAVKAVMLDLVAAVSNVVPAIQASVDKLLLFQETTDPVRDLRFLVETYQTGNFSPQVVIYDNYYSSVDGASVFGVDLELRSRGDSRLVPLLVSAILAYLDATYPLLENDDVRLGLWTVNVPLKATHELRRELNASQNFSEILSKHEPPVVVSALKLYFLELPESLIPSQYYEALRTMYIKHRDLSETSQRLAATRNTLAQLRVSMIATLDVVSAHLKRILTIANATDQQTAEITREVGPLLIRPQQPSALTIGDTFPQQLLSDILNDRENLFLELKRQTVPSRKTSGRSIRSWSTHSHTPPIQPDNTLGDYGGQQRATSTEGEMSDALETLN